jgi:hypothetical protein
VGIEQNLNKLKYFSGTQVEKNYVDMEIKLHQKLIDPANTQADINVKNEKRNTLLVKFRLVVSTGVCSDNLRLDWRQEALRQP